MALTQAEEEKRDIALHALRQQQRGPTVRHSLRSAVPKTFPRADTKRAESGAEGVTWKRVERGSILFLRLLENRTKSNVPGTLPAYNDSCDRNPIPGTATGGILRAGDAFVVPAPLPLPSPPRRKRSHPGPRIMVPPQRSVPRVHHRYATVPANRFNVASGAADGIFWASRDPSFLCAPKKRARESALQLEPWPLSRFGSETLL